MFFFNFFLPDESVQPWINKDYLLTYLPTYLLTYLLTYL